MFPSYFSTIDFIEIDKHIGEMLIYKAGAAITYIIHEDNNIDKIENEGLPFGLNEIVISKKVKLQNNDLVLLASDGIFDNIEWINEVISLASSPFSRRIQTSSPNKQ